jgi:fructose PTS system EIIC component
VMQQRNQMQPAGVPVATSNERVYDDDDDLDI